MSRPDRGNIAATAPLEDLYALLLRQFRRPLAALSADLSDADAVQLAGAIVARAPLDTRGLAVRLALVEVVAESERVLTRWNLTFEQSLATEMDQMPGWELTGQFLDVANEKSNAELRIAGASALAAAMGDLRYAPYLRHLAAGNPTEWDTIIARRTLAFVEGT